MKKLSITVKGKTKTYCFNFYGEEKYIKEWVEQGLEIDILRNTIPDAVVHLGLIKPWCFLQDIFNLKNPFK